MNQEQKTRVMHIASSLTKTGGGPSRSVQGLVAALERSGVETTLVCCRAGDRPWIDGIPRYRAPEAGGLLSLPGFLDRAIEEFSPHVIHLSGIWQLQMHLAARAARRHGIPYIMTPRGMLDPWCVSYKKLKKQIAMCLYQRGDLRKAAALHGTTAKEVAHFRDLGFANPAIVSPNGVNLPATLPERRREGTRRRALYLGRMHMQKGLMELVEAWALSRPKDWLCELVYTTSGAFEEDFERRMKSRVAELGLQDSFVFTGALRDDRKWEAYRRADLFVLPTYSENFGIVVAEALYAGVPVITTKGTPWEELEELKCGRWIEIGAQPLADALKDMTARADEELVAMGLRGRRLVEENYSWDRIAVRLAAEYGKICAPKK